MSKVLIKFVPYAPVSYTHLDVYKRQIYCSVTENPLHFKSYEIIKFNYTNRCYNNIE